MRVFIIGMVILLASPAKAQTLCTEPVKPLCVEELTTYEDELTQDRCEQDIDNFTAQMQEYTWCLNQQIEEAKNRVKSLLDRFACLKSGRTDCP